LEPTLEDTKKRVTELMEKNASWFDTVRGPFVNEEGYKKIAMMAAKMFASIRFFFVKYVRNKLNAFFLDPM
jgi:hypothetical protein